MDNTRYGRDRPYRDWFDEPVLPEPAVPADQISYGVSLAPSSAFEWQALRDELAKRGRQEIGSSNSYVEIGARDRADADQLVADLNAKNLIRTAAVEPLGWFRRWRVRQQLVGNYSGEADPTQRI